MQFGMQFVRRGHSCPRALVLGRRRFCCGAVDRRDKAVSTAGQGFDEAWVRGGIPQRLANLVHRSIQAMIEIDEGIGRPDCFAQVVARDDLTCVLQERGQDLKRLFLQPDASPILAQLSGGQVRLKNAKSQKRGLTTGEHRDECTPQCRADTLVRPAARRSIAADSNRWMKSLLREGVEEALVDTIRRVLRTRNLTLVVDALGDSFTCAGRVEEDN
jgi:hypothetical protein